MAVIAIVHDSPAVSGEIIADCLTDRVFHRIEHAGRMIDRERTVGGPGGYAGRNPGCRSDLGGDAPVIGVDIMQDFDFGVGFGQFAGQQIGVVQHGARPRAVRVAQGLARFAQAPGDGVVGSCTQKNPFFRNAAGLHPFDFRDRVLNEFPGGLRVCQAELPAVLRSCFPASVSLQVEPFRVLRGVAGNRQEVIVGVPAAQPAVGVGGVQGRATY